jgi:hypothetical protein
MSIIFSILFVRYIFRKYISKNYIPGEHKRIFAQVQQFTLRSLKLIPLVLLFMKK